MFDLSRTNIPTVSLGEQDDSAFTTGDVAAWAAVFRSAYRTARSSGVPLQGRVRVSVDLMARIMGEAAPSFLDFPVQQLTTLSLEYDALTLWVDQSLATDTAVLE